MKQSILDQKRFAVIFALICQLAMAGVVWASSANDGFNPGANDDVSSLARKRERRTAAILRATQ